MGQATDQFSLPTLMRKKIDKMEETIRNIGLALKECGDYAQVRGIEIWLEVHGRETQLPPVCAAIMTRGT